VNKKQVILLFIKMFLTLIYIYLQIVPLGPLLDKGSVHIL